MLLGPFRILLMLTAVVQCNSQTTFVLYNRTFLPDIAQPAPGQEHTPVLGGGSRDGLGTGAPRFGKGPASHAKCRGYHGQTAQHCEQSRVNVRQD